MTPQDRCDRLADLRERVANLLSELSTDDLEPQEREWFEHEIAESIQDIDALVEKIVADADLIFTVNGLRTKARDSRLPKSERARVLSRLRDARRAFRGFGAKPSELRRLALAVRDAVRSDCTDPVALESEYIGGVMLARIESDEAARLAIRLENVCAPVGTSVDQWRADLASRGFRAGVRAYSREQRFALDGLVRRGVVTLRPSEAEDHHNAMVRITHSTAR